MRCCWTKAEGCSRIGLFRKWGHHLPTSQAFNVQSRIDHIQHNHISGCFPLCWSNWYLSCRAYQPLNLLSAMSEATQPFPQLPVSRPYRSHKIRACDACRKRKVRCDVTSIGEDCQLCREQGKTCQYSVDEKPPRLRRLPLSDPSASERQRNNTPVLKRRHTLIDDPEKVEVPEPRAQNWEGSHVRTDDRANDAPNRSDKGRQSLHIVGPAVSSDAHVLEQYMSPGWPEGRTNDNPYSVYFSDPSKPLYKKVPRGRVGLSINDNAGVNQREIFEQIFYPKAAQIRQLSVI